MWWVPAVGLVVALKAHFSAAAASDLNWILGPVALLLELFTGWTFEQNAAGEWFSLDARIVLVKACAGFNFMIMSFIGWCWLLRPRRLVALRRDIMAWPLLLCGSLALAWTVTLFVNTLRILAIVHGQSTLEQWLPPDEAHYLLGLAVYLTALNLQLILFKPRCWRRAVLFAAALYLVLMVVVPVMTGNAAEHPALYLRHLLISLVVLLPLTALSLARSACRLNGVPGRARAPLYRPD